jgi:hypothetical protein
MKPAPWLFLMIWVSVSQAVHLCAQEPVRGLSYWEMSWQLRTSRDTQEALEVAPFQKAKLDQACSQLAKDGLFIQVDERLKNTRKGAFSRPDVYLEANEEVRALITKILTPEQLENLWPVMLHAKYPTGYAPFRDHSLFKALNVPTSVMHGDFEKKLQTAKDKHRQRVSQAKLESAKSILADLDEKEKQRFVNWAGNVGLPNCIVDTTDIDSTKKEVISSLDAILDSKEVQQKYQITAVQLNQLQRIQAKYNDEILEGKKENKQLWDEVNNSATQVLTPEQRADYCRDNSWRTFLYDFRVPFSAKVAVSYLGFDKQRQSKLMAKANFARHEFFIAHGKIDREIFESLCEEFPVEVRNRLLKFFKRAWDMPINPYVFWSPKWG